MTNQLTLAGYQQTREKLANLEERLQRLQDRSDLSEQHKLEARRSCEQMIAQYRREIKRYEAAHPDTTAHSKSLRSDNDQSTIH
jgi:hypothetical protein